MGKRKTLEDKREKIAKKIRKLNKKLLKMAEASDSESTDSAVSCQVEEVPLTPIETNVQMEEDTPQILGEEPLPLLEEPVDEDLLNVLGKIDETPKGPVAHAEISQRWTPILAKGLSKDIKLELLNTHIPFENIPLLPPRLNPEIIAAVNEPVKKRDSIIVNRQKQVGAALAAIGKSLQLFLQKGDNIEIFRNINDAGKILCDTFYTDTYSRRTLISAIINKDMKESLTGEADSFLFGKDLSEKIKMTKAVQKSVKDLKSTDRTTKTPNKTRSLNWRGPPRPNTRTHTGGRLSQPGNHQKKENKRPRQTAQNRNTNSHRR